MKIKTLKIIWSRAAKAASWRPRSLRARLAAAGTLALAFLFSSLLIFAPWAHAQTQGPLGATSGADNSGVGTIGWLNTGNITASDGTYATDAITSTSTGHYLFATNFGFTIPTGSTINGIQADVQEMATTGTKNTIKDNSVKIIQAGAVAGTEQSAGAAWPSTLSYVTYGSSSNLWGASWTPAQINATNFGVAISATNVHSSGSSSTLTASVDYIRITVTYTLPPDTQASYRLFNNQDTGAQTTFSEAWGGSNSDQGVSIVQTADGGYAVTGSTYITDSLGGDMYIAKYTAAGSLSWSKTWGGSGVDQGNSIVQTSDGGYAITGYTASYGAGNNDMFIAKYTSTGTLSWSKTWGGTGADAGRSIVQTSDGGYAITGQTASFSTGASGMFIAKYTSTGTLSWSKTWGGSSTDQGYSLVQTTDGGYAVSGSTTSFGAGSTDMFIAKYTSTGTLSWSKTWGGTGADAGRSIVQTSDGGYAITGTSTSFGAGSTDMFIAKYTSTGTLSWSKTWGGTGDDYGYSLVQTSDGGYAVTGDTGSFGVGSDDLFIAKYTAAGSLSWSKTWGGATLRDWGDSIIQTTDGGYAVTGFTSLGAGGSDMFVNKYDSNGGITGCTTTNCRSDGANYTSTNKSDGIGYTSISKADTVGGGADYTSANRSDTTGGGTDYTSTSKADTTGGGADYTSTNKADTTGGGTDYTSTATVVVTSSNTTIGVGTALAAQNTAATIAGDGQAFRLRVDISAGVAYAANSALFKLQYAARGADNACDSSFSGETYADVTNTSTVQYYDNPNAGSGITAATDANDPTDGSNTIIRETYQEKGSTTFTNPTAIAAGQDGLWDFALTTYHTLPSQHYCLRVIYGGGTNLGAYTSTAIGEIITPSAPTYKQAGYRWFNNNNGAQTTFANAWGGSGLDQGYSVVQTSDGGYAVTGKTYSFTDTIGGDMFIAKYTSSGTLSWSKTWGGSGLDQGYSVVQTSDGGYAVTGDTISFGAGGDDMFIAKYTSSGTLSWSKTWGGSGVDYGYSLVQTSDGGYAVTGQTSSFGAGGDDMFIAKYTSAGSLSWSKTWGGGPNDWGNSLVQTSDGGYAVTGGTASFGASFDMFIAKYTSTGTLSWSKTWGGSGADYGQSIAATSDGGYAVTGYTASFGAGGNDMFIAKYTSTGSLSWSKTWGGAGSDQGNSIVATSDGYAVTGNTSSFGAGGAGDVFIAKYTSSGSLSWSKTWGGSGLDQGYSVVQTSDGGYAVTGYTGSFGAGSQDMFIAKYDSSGSIAGCATQCQSDGTGYTSTNQSDGTGYTSTNQSDGTGYISTNDADTIGGGSNYTSTNKADTVGGGTDYTSTNKADTVGGGSDYTSTATVVVASSASASVGTPLPGPNQVGSVATTGTPFRLRLLIGVASTGLSASGQNFKLQYALKAGSCAASSYSDITTTTPVQWYTNSNITNGSGVVTGSGDPTDGSNAVVAQTYNDANNFTNTALTYAGQDGLWDFSLVMAAGSMPSTDVCLRAVTSAGASLGTYAYYPEIQYGPVLTQRLRSGQWFDQNGLLQPFFTADKR